ncbi:MAG: hypothetical protein FWG52_03975 [Proteobacteria bacterium]|nr:hypothetical protein [Pseudomonadota bacterium]
MINVSTSSVTTASFMPSIPAVDNKLAANTASPPASSTTAGVAESSKPIISVQGTILSDLFDAADEFIRQEHLTPYEGVRYSNGKSGYIVQDEGAYLDVGKYNNYLFDKAATALVAQAKEKGIELDKKDVIAQLKSNNPEIAAMKLDNQDRLEKLGKLDMAYYLSWSDLQSFTDMYITAKENSLDTFQVKILACGYGVYQYEQSQPYPVTYTREFDEKPIPESTRKLANDIREKLLDTFGFKMDFFKHILDPSTGLALNSAKNADATEYAKLEFLSKIIDLKNEGMYYHSSQS